MQRVWKPRTLVAFGVACAASVLMLDAGGTSLLAQQSTQAAPQGEKKLSREKLEQIVAPVALYPDSLLAQVLMASTYPLEIVQAARWAAANPSLTGKSLEDALKPKAWEPSVKSIVAFPSVLKMMNDKLEWTQQLGDAFLAQQKDLMTAVQTLRTRAEKAGALKSTKEQKVSKSTTGTTTYIVIEPQNPSVVYVPVYNPGVVYGVWPYPAYPPYYYYPPGYVARGAFWFGVGVAAGSALWGHCHWGRNEININVNNYNRFNRTNISHTTWRHDVTHRRGVPYSTPDVAREFRQNHRDHAAREQFRGHDLDHGRVSGPAERPANRDLDRARDLGSSEIRREGPGDFRDRQSSAFDGAGSGRDVRNDSLRGQSSRISSTQRPGRAAGERPARGGGPGGRGR